MRAGWIVAVLAGAAMAGCAGGEPGNPNLAAPKLVIAPREGENASVFVHSAFGERMYDWLSLEIDNVSVANRTQSFSLEEEIPDRSFLTARAVLGDALYEYRARIDVFHEEDRASVTTVELDGEWAKEPESFELPYETFLARRGTP